MRDNHGARRAQDPERTSQTWNGLSQDVQDVIGLGRANFECWFVHAILALTFKSISQVAVESTWERVDMLDQDCLEALIESCDLI